MNKQQFLEHWKNLPANQPINPTVIPYKHEGRTYGEDGIRITGNRAFIDSVLSRLQDLLVHENDSTRLNASYAQQKDRETQQPVDSFTVYIQVRERGGEAQIANSVFGRPK
jgi:hypothetical protein